LPGKGNYLCSLAAFRLSDLKSPFWPVRNSRFGGKEVEELAKVGSPRGAAAKLGLKRTTLLAKMS
jgi:hypothetical protein